MVGSGILETVDGEILEANGHEETLADLPLNRVPQTLCILMDKNELSSLGYPTGILVLQMRMSHS